MESNSRGIAAHNLEMFAVANEYCHFIENCHKFTYDDVILFLQKILPLLYLKAAVLPQAEAEEDSINERYVTEEQYESVFNSLRGVFKKDDEFNAIPDEDIIKLSLSELLSDIYQDMRDYILLYQHPISSSKLQAACNISELFKYRWGAELLDAMVRIHRLSVTSDGDEFDEESFL